MQTRTIKTTVVAASAAVTIGLMGAPLAVADDATAATTTTIGQQAKIDADGVVQSWTVTGLQPSSDVISYAPRGTLWEATATNEAIQGSVQPMVSYLNARAADGENYRVLWGVATEQGVNPAPLAQGEKTTGKVYFDVTGTAPESVVYNDGEHDLLVWKPAPPATTGSGGQWTPPAERSPAQTAPEPAATGSTGTPITEGTPATPAPAAGSQGTPLPAGTPPAPAPAAGSAGTPVGEGTPAAPAMPPAPAAGSAGTPVGEGTPAVPVPHGPGRAGTPAS